MSRSQASVLILVFCEEEERKVSMKAKFLTQLPLILSFAWKILLLICVGACHWHAFPLQNTSVCVCVCVWVLQKNAVKLSEMTLYADDRQERLPTDLVM